MGKTFRNEKNSQELTGKRLNKCFFPQKNTFSKRITSKRERKDYKTSIRRILDNNEDL
jgi:hypothetical protein